MLFRILTISLLTFLLSACFSNPDYPAQLEAAQTEIQALKTQLENRIQAQEEQISFENTLVHIVLLQLNEDISDEEKETLVKKLESLADIPTVKNLQIGMPEDTDDPRAMTDYDLVLHMGFSSLDNLVTYQKDENHLAIRADLKPYLAKPPVVYDFQTK